MEVEHDEIEPIEEETPQRPKRKLSPEHLAKMKAGRKRYLANKQKAKRSMIIDDESEEEDNLMEEDERVVRKPPKPKPKPIKKKKTKVVNTTTIKRRTR